jgi:hypothetical protein
MSSIVGAVDSWTHQDGMVRLVLMSDSHGWHRKVPVP